MRGVYLPVSVWAVPLSAGLSTIVALAAVYTPVLTLGAAAGVGVLGAWAVAWRAVLARPRILLPATMAGSLTLLGMPQALPVNQQAVKFAVLLPFWLAIVQLLGPRRHPVDRRMVVALGTFLAVTAIALLRGGYAGNYGSLIGGVGNALMYLTVTAFGYLAFTRARGLELRTMTYALALSPGVLASVSLVLYAVGVRNRSPDIAVATAQQAELLGLLGVQMDRVLFPLTGGVANFGMICGMGLAAAIVLAVHDKNVRTLAILSAGACLPCILMGDNRTALFIALLVGTAVAMFPRIKATSGVALLIPLGPVIAIAVLGYIAGTGFGESINSDQRDIATGSNRQEIWETVWRYLQEPHLQDIVGYGAGGQIASGVSRRYASLFAGTADPFSYSAHNGLLQTTLDSGYVGAAVLLVFLFMVLRRLPPALLAAVVVLVVGSVMDSAPTYYSPEALTFLLVAGAVAAISPRGSSRIPSQRPR